MNEELSFLFSEAFLQVWICNFRVLDSFGLLGGEGRDWEGRVTTKNEPEKEYLYDRQGMCFP